MGDRRRYAGRRGDRDDGPPAQAGPSTLDRLVATDTLVAGDHVQCVGTWAAYSRDTTVTHSLAALALIGFCRLGEHRPVPRAGPRRHSGRGIVNALDVLTAVLVLTGSFLALTAAIGVVRFPDTLTRMQRRPSHRCSGYSWCWAGPRSNWRDHVDVGMIILTGIFHHHHGTGGRASSRAACLPRTERQ